MDELKAITEEVSPVVDPAGRSVEAPIVPAIETPKRDFASELAEKRTGRETEKRNFAEELKAKRGVQARQDVMSANLEAKGVPQKGFLATIGEGVVNFAKKGIEGIKDGHNTFVNQANKMPEVAENIVEGTHDVLMGGSKDFGTMLGKMGGNFETLEQNQKTTELYQNILKNNPDLPEDIKKELENPNYAEFYEPTLKEQLGTAGMSALELATAGMVGAEANVVKNTAVNIAKNQGTGKMLNMLKLMGESGSIASGFAMSQSAKENASNEEIIEAGIGGAVVGASIPLAGAGLSKVVGKSKGLFNDITKKVTGKKGAKLRKQAYKLEQKVLEDSAQVLQSGSKATALTKGEKFSQADKSFAKVITSGKKKIDKYDDAVRLVQSSSKGTQNKVGQKIKPFAEVKSGDKYLARLREKVAKLKGDPQTAKSAVNYEKILMREEEFLAKNKNLTIGQLQDRKIKLGKMTGDLYKTGGGKVELTLEQKAEKQALDLLRGGARKEIEDVAGAKVGELNRDLSGLIDAEAFLKVQRERAKNAIQDLNFKDKNWVDKLAQIKEWTPIIKDIGKGDLMKLDTKSDVLEALLEGKVKAMRRMSDEAISLRSKISSKELSKQLRDKSKPKLPQLEKTKKQGVSKPKIVKSEVKSSIE